MSLSSEFLLFSLLFCYYQSYVYALGIFYLQGRKHLFVSDFWECMDLSFGCVNLTAQGDSSSVATEANKLSTKPSRVLKWTHVAMCGPLVPRLWLRACQRPASTHGSYLISHPRLWPLLLRHTVLLLRIGSLATSRACITCGAKPISPHETLMGLAEWLSCTAHPLLGWAGCLRLAGQSIWSCSEKGNQEKERISMGWNEDRFNKIIIK